MRSLGSGLAAALRRMARIEKRDEGRAEAFAQPQDVGDGPGGVTWQQIVQHAAANPRLLSAWENQLVDSVSRGLRYGVPPTARQCAKLEWIFVNRLGGKLP